VKTRGEKATRDEHIQHTPPTLDMAEFKRALEEREVAAQLALHAHDAEVTLVDRINTPGSPSVLRGREEGC
jgi:hypothetical protein